jgi:hypothetical protein
MEFFQDKKNFRRRGDFFPVVSPTLDPSGLEIFRL